MRNEIIFLTSLVWLLSSANGEHRVKRKVLFTKNSKLFFRLNGKDNVIPWTQIFAHGWAFRVNWDLPESLPKRHKFFKRDLQSEFEDSAAMQGYSCILNYFCDFAKQIKSSKECGIFCEIGNIIARSEGVDAEFFQSVFNKCPRYLKHCSDSFQDEFLDGV